MGDWHPSYFGVRGFKGDLTEMQPNTPSGRRAKQAFGLSCLTEIAPELCIESFAVCEHLGHIWQLVPGTAPTVSGFGPRKMKTYVC